jgi:hypothetical protein
MCGPIGVSAREDFLCFAEPHYVAKLARGNRWISRGLTVAQIATLLLLFGGVLASFVPTSGTFDAVVLMLWFLLFGILLLSGIVLFLVGVWLVTSAEPGISAGWRRDRARKLVRACLLVGALAIALDLWLEAVVPPPGIMAAFKLLAIGFSVFGVTGLFAYFRFVRDIVDRLPDRGLAARAGTLARDFAIVTGTLALLGAIERLIVWAPALVTAGTAGAPAAAGMPLGVLGACLGVVARLAALVLFFRAIRLHSNLRKPLEQQAVLAEKHWQATARVT